MKPKAKTLDWLLRRIDEEIEKVDREIDEQRQSATIPPMANEPMPAATHIAYMKKPGQWARNPYCPLKHISRKDARGYPLLGYLTSIHGFTVFHGILGLKARGLYGDKSEEYKSAEEVYAAGWRVD